LERKTYWYSIIQYVPDLIKGELINIGLILHCPENGEIFRYLCDEGSNKIKAFLYNDVYYRTFRTQINYIELYLNQIIHNRSLFDPELTNKLFLYELAEKLPKEFKLSEPTFSLSRNPEQLVISLQRTYIGEPIKSTELSTIDSHINVKNFTRQYFNTREWIGTKIKSNCRIHPLKEVKNVEFIVDFVFKNGIWNLMQTVPSNTSPEKLTDWFSKNSTMLETFKDETQFYIIYDEKDQLNSDKTIDDMIRYLQKRDERVIRTEIKSSSFNTLCEKVEKEAKDISHYSEELLAM
jgi:hypothetical protein